MQEAKTNEHERSVQSAMGRKDATMCEDLVHAIGQSQAIVEYGLDGTILSASERFQSLMGYGIESLKGRNRSEFVDPEFANSSEFKDAYAALRRGEVRTIELKCRNKSDEEIWLRASCSPLFNGDGELCRIVEVATDVTEQIEALKLRDEAARLVQMVDDMPINVVMCDKETFEITYANKASFDTLRQLEGLLPVKAGDLVGQCIDIFHKDPSHQRRILSDPNNLPHTARIELGGEVLDLQVTAIRDKEGAYVGPMLTWSVVTGLVAKEKETARLMQMLDEMPVNVMFVDKDTFEITYINKTSVKTLQPLQHLLPCPSDELVGQCIDIFHKEPSHQRRILASPANLPHKAKIKLGDETLDLLVSAINDSDGTYIGPMLSWQVVTEHVAMADDFENNVATVVEGVSAAATEMESSAKAMTDAAAVATEKSATVASAAEQLQASINEISRQVTQSSAIANQAVDEATRSNEMIAGLKEGAEKIGDIVSIIQDIASQTNLLALNATIEAARAGEAGKGFAVVASEVKALANQTAKATDEIGDQITSIQESTNAAVQAIDTIGKTINELSTNATAISSAVEEQSAATAEVSSNIAGVSEASNETGGVANDVTSAAAELGKQANDLQSRVGDFLVQVRAI